MRSAWATSDAEAAVARYPNIPRDLALRVYTTRLLGADRKLVLHGGGNTSVKTRLPDLNGDEVDVLCVKGSGWDMAAIEPAGLPAVRLAPLLKLRTRDTLCEADFIRLPRANLIDPWSPAPSVELLLHAFMPAKFIDHTHASAVLSLTDQPDGVDLCGEVFGERLGIVPYVMPGFGLARKAADVFDARTPRDPRVDASWSAVTAALVPIRRSACAAEARVRRASINARLRTPRMNWPLWSQGRHTSERDSRTKSPNFSGRSVGSKRPPRPSRSSKPRRP